jgi:hypothetical protein
VAIVIGGSCWGRQDRLTKRCNRRNYIVLLVVAQLVEIIEQRMLVVLRHVRCQTFELAYKLVMCAFT